MIYLTTGISRERGCFEKTLTALADIVLTIDQSSRIREQLKLILFLVLFERFNHLPKFFVLPSFFSDA